MALNNITFSVPSDLYIRELKKKAKKNKMTMSAYIRFCIDLLNIDKISTIHFTEEIPIKVQCKTFFPSTSYDNKK